MSAGLEDSLDPLVKAQPGEPVPDAITAMRAGGRPL
jgi:hypothetical protein